MKGGCMSYSKQELDKLVQSVLQIAKDNLLKDGFVQPVGLLYGTTGLQNIFPMKFSGVEEKRAVQSWFKTAILETGALAAVVVTESWYRIPTPGEPVDPTRSVREYSDRMEAIVVEAASPLARHIIIQIFTKSTSGRYEFAEPFAPSPEITWFSEWLDDVWNQQQHGGEHGITIQ